MNILPSVWRFLCLCVVWILSLSAPVLFAAAPQLTLDPASPFEVPGLPLNSFFPDGHTAWIADGSGSLVFAAGEDSYRIELDSNGDIASNPSWPVTKSVLSKGVAGDASYSYDNGGAWLYSVHRVGNTQKLLGFYHAEDHWPGVQNSIANYTWIAWKSIALAVSEDNGRTWQKRGQIITSPNPRPSIPQWGGAGDHCVVWDAANARWLCFYGSDAVNGICMAQSKDPEGAPGTWFKFYNGSFSEPGLGGKESPAPGLGTIPGANPSVHFNSKLNRWVMVFHTYDIPQLAHPNSLYIASSLDLVQWDTPELLLAPAAGYQRYWNPTIIGTSDVSAGQNATLIYGAWPDKTNPRRQLMVRDIVFNSMSSKVPPTLDLDADISVVPGVTGATTSYQITGSETPTSFRANLPQGFSISSSGRITGVPAIAGLELGSVVAANEAGESHPAALLFVNEADVTATSAQGAVVNYTLPSAATLGLKAISGSPASGSVFPVGISTVTVSATYPNGDSVSLPFKVTVHQGSTEVGGAPKIVTQPASTSVTAGAALELNVTATGTGTLFYQWRKNGVEIAGATLARLMINSAAAGDSGIYDVVVRTATGATAQSATATVVVNTPVTIRTQPSGLALVSGQSGTLTVTASGDAPLFYQWRKDQRNITGATAASYTISNASSGDAGSYDVVVSNSAGSKVSNAALVSVSPPTQIIRPPEDISLTAGSVATLSVLASGNGTLSYQWFRNGILIPGATSAQLSLGALSEASKGTYRVEVSGNPGGVVSASAVVDVKPEIVGAPKIVTQPANTSVNAGAIFALNVAATGTGTLSYQWRKDGVEIPGATLSRLLFNGASAGDAGSYDVVVSTAAGTSVQSATARVVLNVPAAILTQPSDLWLTSGQSGALTVAASGDGPLVYQWRKDGKIIPGATAASYAVSNATELSAGRYEVLVSNVAGSVTSNSASVVVSVPAQILRPPADVSLAAGSMVTLSVLARGSGSLSYQWYRDGVEILGANAPQLSLGALSQASKGTYRVSVRGDAGDFAWASAVVNVLPSNPAAALAILAQPTDVVMLKGSAVSLPVAVEPAPSESVRTRYQLNSFSAGKLTPLTLAGNIGASGQLNLLLSSLSAASGDYVLVFSRDFGNGTVVEARSQPFRVETRSWEDAAGTYEALLVDRGAAPYDGAHYRGLLSMTVSKNGSISGRIFYNQAPPLPAGGTAAPRLYLPVTRAFSGALVPEPGAPLRFSLTPKLGNGVQASLQEMTISLDFSDSPAVLSVTVLDHLSADEGNDCISVVESVSRLPAGLPALLSDLPGRYTVVANGLPSGVDDSGQLLVQVLASGRIVWTSRLPGYAGTGSASLNTNDPSNPTFELYEARLQMSASLFNSNSWLAQVGFKTIADNTRQAYIPAGALERQSSYVGKLPATAGSPTNYSFNPQTHWSAVSLVDFSDGDGARWAKAGTAGLPAFFRTNTPLQLTVSDLQQDSSPVTYSWNLNISSAGAVKATGIAGAQGLPPVLSLRLDKTSGELQGSYSVKGVRRSVFGAALRGDEGVTTLGRGWIETPAASKVAPRKWSLDLIP